MIHGYESTGRSIFGSIFGMLMYPGNEVHMYCVQT
jgi:hypothetical protein